MIIFILIIGMLMGLASVSGFAINNELIKKANSSYISLEAKKNVE